MDATTLGVRRGAVSLSAADPTWAEAYEHVLPLLRGALAGIAVAIEHVGSTAVPGLPAKPILDIAVGLSPGRDPAEVHDPLLALGFLYRGSGEGRTWRDYLALRDALRADPEVRDAYAALKQELAERFPTDRAAYIAGKDAFVARILAGG